MARIEHVTEEILKTKSRIYVHYYNGHTEVYTDTIPMKIIRFMHEEDTYKLIDNEMYKNKTIIDYGKEIK